MCRLLGYLGSPTRLENLIYKPEHSLVVQSYQPRQMTSGVVNADGFGVGWYHPQQVSEAFTYRSTVPIWNDANLPSLSRYIESGCVLAYVRSATAGQALDVSNCQPFVADRLSCIHNGFIENFRQTLYRPIRDRLSDKIYQMIRGTTDSEHIFGLFLQEVQSSPELPLEKSLYKTLTILADLAQVYQTSVSANLILSDGQRLVASRYAVRGNPDAPPLPAPSLYWLQDHPLFPQAVLIASEPLFPGNWMRCPDRCVLTVGDDLDVQIHQF
ncbi:MAG: ergothioneine biosynthesis protein EgtC [Leptolyngbyaceae cyanobacterium bins.59]|nr:ergothioneine biosynthesis protein EgtC [Leptolyngbyaceae cyanobacterium bins.59]